METKTQNTIRHLAANATGVGVCDVCFTPNTVIRFADGVSGVAFGECCLNFVCMLAKIGIRPPTHLEWVAMRQAGH